MFSIYYFLQYNAIYVLYVHVLCQHTDYVLKVGILPRVGIQLEEFLISFTGSTILRNILYLYDFISNIDKK